MSWGLIINEIITNSIKHSQEKKADLEIYIYMEGNNTSYALSIGDNGPGMDLNQVKRDSLEIELIELFAEQLSANIKYINKTPGVHYQITLNKAIYNSETSIG